MTPSVTPGLFGQTKNNSTRDYSKAYYWGKNQFNSSFPASLVAYMHSRGIRPVYLRTDKNGNIYHSEISAAELLGIDPLSDRAFYNFETGYPKFEKFYTGNREKIDLVMTDRETDIATCGLEIKLTALPDNTTKDKSEDHYGCEMVVRPPTICFLACSICGKFDKEEGQNVLRHLLSGVRQINHWEEMEEVLPHYGDIKKSILSVIDYLVDRQTPLILQPIWKTVGNKMVLADNCLDCFVWSNLALIKLCCDRDPTLPVTISRPMRAVIWLYRMLFDYATYGQFDYVRIIKLHSYTFANDKAFALSGIATWPYMQGQELLRPRVHKDEIKNIILGGGQELLSPERRFDAVLASSPELFE